MAIPRKKPDCQAVWDFWRDLQSYTPEGWARFLALYEGAVGGDKLHEADVEDAAVFVGSFSWEGIMQRRETYASVEAELNRFFEHPEVVQADWRIPVEFRCRLALCALAQGRETEGLSVLRTMISRRRGWLRGSHEIRFSRGAFAPFSKGGV